MSRIIAVLLVSMLYVMSTENAYAEIFICKDSLGRRQLTDKGGAGCKPLEPPMSSAEMKAVRKRQEELAETERSFFPKLELAKKQASVKCMAKLDCDKMFALVEIYIATNADLKIQVSTLTTIETFNPVGIDDLALGAIKEPGAKASATITLRASCSREGVFFLYGPSPCLKKSLAAYTNFRPFIEKKMAQ